jgi:hypothetical protein
MAKSKDTETKEPVFVPSVTFAMDYNSKTAMALEMVKGQMQVVGIEAHGLVHQHMGRDYFLRHYYRDILQEEWPMVCRHLKIALAKDQNELEALQILEKVIEMKLAELKTKTMAELVEMHNELAKAIGGKTVTKFKSLEAGKLEVIKMSKAKPASAAATAKEAKTGGGVEGRKRNGVGKRSKDLLLEGKTVDETFTIIRKEFPDNSTTKPCISYYKNALVKEGKLPGGRAKKEEEKVPAKPVKGSKNGKKAKKEEAATA